MAHVLASKRVPVRHVVHLLPPHFLEQLEQNQKIATCCRHPQDHEIESFYSDEDEAATGKPNIYIFHCSCGRKHHRFMVGGGDMRPKWDSR